MFSLSSTSELAGAVRGRKGAGGGKGREEEEGKEEKGSRRRRGKDGRRMRWSNDVMKCVQTQRAHRTYQFS